MNQIGKLLAVALFVLVLLFGGAGLTPESHKLAAIMIAVVTLWVTEAIPMPATALIGAVACIVMQVAPAKEVFPLFGDPIIFLFIGSFLLGQALSLHRLDQRIALSVLSLKWVGSDPGRILFIFGATAALISAWISNTATTVMMMAIGTSILSTLKRAEGQFPKNYAVALMLMASFASSVGGLATPVGTPPNLIGLNMIRELPGVDVPFFTWCLFGIPIVLITYLAMYFIFRLACPSDRQVFEGTAAMLDQRKNEMGQMSIGEISTTIAMLVTILLWVLPGLLQLFYSEKSPIMEKVQAILPESVAALIGGLLLFLLPGGEGRAALNWKEASGIDWGVIFIYGGGITFGKLMEKTGLSSAIGLWATSWIGISNEFMLIVAASLIAVIVSEATSNTAAATIVVPFVITFAINSEIDPVGPALAATMACSMGFMLPVSTPCNAIVYGTGYIPLGKMIRYGFFLDIIGTIAVIAVVSFLRPILIR